MNDKVPSSEIEILHGLEPIRRRPEMYVGPVDDPQTPNLLLREALCCARDDALLDQCKNAEVVLYSNGRCSIRDDGPGWPLDAVEKFLCELSACASHKSSKKAADSTCTIGLAAVNALSASLSVRVFREGAEWVQHYAAGRPVTKLQREGPSSECGTQLSFQLDGTILKRTEFRLPELRTWVETEVVRLEVRFIDRRVAEANGFKD